MALIRGTRRDDTLYASDGDRVNAFAGDDSVFTYGGTLYVQMGRGNDTVENVNATGGEVWAGVGDDAVYWFGAGQIVGGKGNDLIIALDGSNLYGDEGPGLAHRTAGNDILQTYATSAGGVSTQTGGKGADWHVFAAQYDGLGGASVCDVTDFTAGQDKLAMSLSFGLPAGGSYLNSAQIWAILDTNGDGVLNGTDVPPDAGSGTAVVGDNLAIRVGDDTMWIEHTTSITAADWLFT